MSMRHSCFPLIGGAQHPFSDRSSAIHFTQHEFLHDTGIQLLLQYVYACMEVCACMHTVYVCPSARAHVRVCVYLRMCVHECLCLLLTWLVRVDCL